MANTQFIYKKKADENGVAFIKVSEVESLPHFTVESTDSTETILHYGDKREIAVTTKSINGVDYIVDYWRFDSFIMAALLARFDADVFDENYVYFHPVSEWKATTLDDILYSLCEPVVKATLADTEYKPDKVYELDNTVAKLFGDSVGKTQAELLGTELSYFHE